MIINGKQVEYRFGMLAVELFLTKAAKIGSTTYSSFGIASIIHAGVVNYYEVKELPHPVTFEEIYDYVESKIMTDAEMDEIKKAISDFENSQALAKTGEKIDKVNEEVKKKTLTSEASDSNTDSDLQNTNG